MRLEAVRRLWQRLKSGGEAGVDTGSFTDSELELGRMVLPLINDVEEAKKAIDKMAHTTRTLRAALDLLPVAAVVLDEEGGFLTSNAAACDLFGGPAIPASILKAARTAIARGSGREADVVPRANRKSAPLRVVPAELSEAAPGGGPVGKPGLVFLVPEDGGFEVATGPLISHHGLSRSQAKVVALVAQGLSNREVASRLDLSPETVRSHLRTIFEKTGVKNRAALVALAFGARFGLSPPASDDGTEV